MELRELLRRLGRRLWILVIVPIVAVGVMVPLASQDPTKYGATATVSVSVPSGQESAANLNQAIASITSAAVSQGVLASVAESSGATAAQIEGGLSTRRIGTSELVEFTYVDTDKAVVAKVIDAMPKAAQEAVFASIVRQAEKTEDLAKKSYDSALSKLADVRKSTGLILPEAAYQAKSTEVTQLRVALVTALTRPDTQTSEPIAAALATAEKELAALGPKVTEFSQPQFELDRARQAQATAAGDLLDVQSRRDSAEAATATGQVVAQARSTDLVRVAASAAVIGFAIAVLLLLLSELLRRSRRTSDDEIAGADGPDNGSDGPQLPGDGSGAGAAERSPQGASV